MHLKECYLQFIVTRANQTPTSIVCRLISSVRGSASNSRGGSTTRGCGSSSSSCGLSSTTRRPSFADDRRPLGDIMNEFPLINELGNVQQRKKRKRQNSSFEIGHISTIVYANAVSMPFLASKLEMQSLRPHPDLQIMKGTVEFDLFKRGVACFCYTENAFPNIEEERIACVTLAKRIFNEILSKRRTSLPSAVGVWLDKQYDLFARYVPQDIMALGKKEICGYLLVDNCFARTNFEINGPYLYSDAIADCICFMLLNHHSGNARLLPYPDIIGRQVICLVTLMLCWYSAIYAIE
ncbi:hypothetical protein BDC45DRAFT_542689 [Circinella umbellata]|nr:hypothetical protein BDC45DRAFT_542689 [Circinella umbellata]